LPLGAELNFWSAKRADHPRGREVYSLAGAFIKNLSKSHTMLRAIDFS